VVFAEYTEERDINMSEKSKNALIFDSRRLHCVIPLEI